MGEGHVLTLPSSTWGFTDPAHPRGRRRADVVRTHLSKGLGFSREDRDTNIRRIGWVCQLLTKHGVPNIAAAISPYRDVREEGRWGGVLSRST